jgi:hypothetical protein
MGWEVDVDEQDEANAQADDALYNGRSRPREPDPYPDTGEAQAFVAQWAKAEVLGLDPATLHMLEAGCLEL